MNYTCLYQPQGRGILGFGGVILDGLGHTVLFELCLCYVWVSFEDDEGRGLRGGLV